MSKTNDYIIGELEESMDSMLDDPDYYTKIACEEKGIDIKSYEYRNDKTVSRPVARVRNRRFRHKQWRRFLSYYPALDVKTVDGLPGHNGIFDRGSYYDDKMDMYYNRHLYYNLNLYNHLFISKRGDIRSLRGKIEIWRHDMSFVTGKPAWIKDIRKRTNRCVRRMRIDEENSNSWNYYRKQHIEHFD